MAKSEAALWETARKRSAVRIAVGGKYLDEVQIRQALPYQPGCVSYLSFPVARHRAVVEVERVTLFVQAPTVVQLYASGVLPPIGGGATDIEIAGQNLGEWELLAVESGERSGIDDLIVLRFRKATGAAP